MTFNEVCKEITLRSPSILFEQIKRSSCNKENRILVEYVHKKVKYSQHS